MVGVSLRLEHEEGLVVAFEQVEEEHPLRLVSDRGSERLARNHVPSGGLVFEVGVASDLGLNLGCQFFVEASFLRGLLANYSTRRVR